MEKLKKESKIDLDTLISLINTLKKGTSLIIKDMDTKITQLTIRHIRFLAKMSLKNKWKKPNNDILNQCSFCEDTISADNLYYTCSLCFIDKRLCNISNEKKTLFGYITDEYTSNALPANKQMKYIHQIDTTNAYLLFVSCMEDIAIHGKILSYNSIRLDEFLKDNKY